jgi:hypothetical protein
MYDQVRKTMSFGVFGISLLSSLLSGLVAYLILSFLFIPGRILLPIPIIFSVLTFGLINYYYVSINPSRKSSLEPDSSLDKYSENISEKSRYEDNDDDISFTGPYFILLYIISIIVVVYSSHINRELYLPWEQISILQIIQLASAILISFFMPGYAIISILVPKNRLELLPRFLLAYILSIFITGFIVYLTASLGADFPTTSNILIVIQVLIFISYISFVFLERKDNSKRRGAKYLGYILLLTPLSSYISKNFYKKWIKSIAKNSLELIVFISLFALVVLSTYFLYGGAIIGDQWFHHGRALSFVSSTFNVASLADELRKDPPLFSSFLAGFFNMSGLPTVNTYAAINFVNIVPVLAFSYFFSKWVPGRRRKAALLASVLFMLSSGFGWAYLLYLTGINQAASEQDSLNVFNDARIKSFDIFQPSSFVVMDHPGITSPLIVVSLPAGFILLGLIAEKNAQKESKFIRLRYLVIVTILSLAGALSHPEFILFITTASVLALIFKLPRRNIIFAGFITSLSLLVLMNVLPGQYTSATKIAGIPLVYLSLVFTVLISLLSIFRVRLPRISMLIGMIKPNSRIHLRLILSVALVSFLVYFYIFTFLVWGELSLQDVRTQTSKDGQREIPWYLYPMKLGVCGLLGLFFLASYLFRRFEKEILVFGIFSVLALLTGTYYDEHRFSKYIMVGLVGLAAIAVYDITMVFFSSRKRGAKLGPTLPTVLVSIIIAFTVISASMSAILYVGYSALAIDNHYRPFDRDLPKRYFPSPSEISLLKFIFNDLSQDGENYNVVTSPDEYKIRQDGFAGKLEAFVGIPERKLLQGQDVLENSTLEQFYQSLNNSNAKYIVLPKENIINGIQQNYTNATLLTSGPSSEELIEPARFALANFEKVYENNDYVVLSVPDNLLSAKEDSNTDGGKMPDTRLDLKLNDIVNLPGDISERAKRSGVEVPWQKVMGSEISIAVAVLIPVVALIIVKRSLSRRIKKKNNKL